ncbi:MAG: LysR substrate-binding domain-containing protein [Candidatus Bathyarchaeia archaeon]|jgi:DNA-binding transcriptional LysR family regulator
MRFDYLTTFLTVARTNSYSIAAKELKLSQGTVSHQIAALEEYFETELFKRTATGVTVTEEGTIIKATAEKILQEVHDTKAKISESKQVLSGTIRISASTIPEEHIIPGLIFEFQKSYPKISFKITAQDSLISLNSLQVGTMDFAAVGTILGFEDQFDFIAVGEEKLVLIAPCNHNLAKYETVKLTELLQYPFIDREETSGTRREIEHLLEVNNFSVSMLNVVLQLGSTESVITAVSEARGISIISSIAAAKAEAAGLVKTVKIAEAKNSRKLYMAKPKKSLVKGCEVFWEFCKKFTYKNASVSCKREIN